MQINELAGITQPANADLNTVEAVCNNVPLIYSLGIATNYKVSLDIQIKGGQYINYNNPISEEEIAFHCELMRAADKADRKRNDKAHNEAWNRIK